MCYNLNFRLQKKSFENFEYPKLKSWARPWREEVRRDDGGRRGGTPGPTAGKGGVPGVGVAVGELGWSQVVAEV
jgi:hypothetical protein